MLTPDKQLSAEQSRQVAETIREEIARRRISRQSLAEQAKLSLSTLEKVLGGRRPFTLATTVRPSFGGDKDVIYAYRTEIAWEAAVSSLVFREGERQDAAYTQFGEVAVPNQSGHIYLVTNRHGQHRLITVSRPRISGEMYGILTTLLAGRGSLLTPIAAPIVFLPIKNIPAASLGRISSDDANYAVYREHLRRTTDEPFALFLPG